MRFWYVKFLLLFVTCRNFYVYAFLGEYSLYEIIGKLKFLVIVIITMRYLLNLKKWIHFYEIKSLQMSSKHF